MPASLFGAHPTSNYYSSISSKGASQLASTMTMMSLAASSYYAIFMLFCAASFLMVARLPASAEAFVAGADFVVVVGPNTGTFRRVLPARTTSTAMTTTRTTRTARKQVGVFLAAAATEKNDDDNDDDDDTNGTTNKINNDSNEKSKQQPRRSASSSFITKEQQEHLDKFGPNPEIVGEILFDKLTETPDVLLNALLPDGNKWKDLIVNFKQTRKEDQRLKAERKARQEARDEERKARRLAEKQGAKELEEVKAKDKEKNSSDA